jgi:hypothetical protein
MEEPVDKGSLREAEEKIKKTLSSPRTPGVALAIGSITWRIIGYWSNVDFILSVREERISMILEALLDWGWIALIICGAIWAFYTPPSEDKTRVNVGLAIASGIICFMGGILITTQANSSLPNVLTGWAVSTQNCAAQVNESKLIGFAKKYRIVLLCGIGNPRVDPFEDTLITLSSAFRITGATDQTIDAPIGKSPK